MPEATEQPPDTTVFSPYLEQPAPDLAATLSTQAEEANDENISFLLRTRLPDEYDSSHYDDSSDRRRRMRRAVDAMVEPRVYTVSQWSLPLLAESKNVANSNVHYQPAQLQELGDLQEPSYAERRSRHEYHGWAPGASDDEESSHQRNSSSQSSAALFDERVSRSNEQQEYLRDRIRLRRLRDATQLEWRDLVPADPMTHEATSQDQSHFAESGGPTVTESSLRTTALLQAVRRNPTFSARSRNELQRYILDRERGDDRDRLSSARTNELSNSNISPSQRRQMNREATVRQEMQQQRDLLAEHQQHRNYLEEQLRQQRQGLIPPSENRRRRYWQTPSPCRASDKKRIDSAIKYLGQLRLCESDQEGQETAEEGGFVPEEFCLENRQDFLVNTQTVPPPPESSWLQIGGVLFGTQHGASPSSSLPSYAPLIPPSTYRARTRNPHFGSVPPRATSPSHQMPDDSSSQEEEECWPVKVTIHGIDYSTMTLSGTMEAFNVPDKSSPTEKSSITTFLEGEIIDFNTFTLETKSFQAGARVDGMYWRKLPPFNDLGDDEAMVKALLSKEWLENELMRKWILMRWKEKCFVTPSDAQTALTISGFYYVSLRRANGHVEGLYYDPHSNPYQHLSLSPQKRTFPAYTFT